MRGAQKGGLPPTRPWRAKTRPCLGEGRTRYSLYFTPRFGCRYEHPRSEEREKKSLSVDRSLGERDNVIKWTG
jgi:hypothetical protein